MNNKRKILKFFIGYFNLLLPLLLPSQKLFDIIILILTGFKNIDAINIKNFYPSFATVLNLSILFLIYYLIYRRWGNLKLLIGVIIATILTDFLLGIVIIFTFPIWIGIGLVLLAYGLFTGLFKKNVPQTNNSAVLSINSNTVTDNNNQLIKNSSSKKKYIAISLLIISIFAILYLINFGGIYPCEHSYDKVEESRFKIGEKVVLNEDALLLTGSNVTGLNCRWAGVDFSKYIMRNRNSNSCINCTDENGVYVSAMPKGKEFTFIGAYDVESKGFFAKWGSNNFIKKRWWSIKDDTGVSYIIFSLFDSSIISPLEGFEKN